MNYIRSVWCEIIRNSIGNVCPKKKIAFTQAAQFLLKCVFKILRRVYYIVLLIILFQEFSVGTFSDIEFLLFESRRFLETKRKKRVVRIRVDCIDLGFFFLCEIEFSL